MIRLKTVTTTLVPHHLKKYQSRLFIIDSFPNVFSIDKRNYLRVSQTAKKCPYLLFQNSWILKLRTPFIRNISGHSLEDTILDNEEVLKLHLNNLTNEYRHSEEQFSRSKTHPFEISRLLSSRISIIDNLASLEELKLGTNDDNEMKSQIESEKAEYGEKLRRVDHELLSYLIPEEPYDRINDVIIEIKAGVGGQEAMLFAKNLLQLYCGYASYKGWDHCIDEFSSSEIGGIRSCSITVSGSDALKHYCHEAGVHRVQRVPVTEKSGRIHTSAVSVSVMAQPTEVEVKLIDSELKIETKRASGPGGQNVNKTDSAVRIIHLPTGIAVECQTDRSQIKNRASAMNKLRAKLYQIQADEQMKRVSRTRKFQMGSGDRSEKIRTYNFQQDRITDHRIGYTAHNIDIFLSGSDSFDKLIMELRHEAKKERFIEFIDSLKKT